MSTRSRQPHQLLHAFLVLLLVFVAVGTSSPASAQVRSVEVSQRDGDITVLSNGLVRIQEIWTVHFSGGPFRSAFRSIPYNGLTDITDWSISDVGGAYQASASHLPGTFEVIARAGEEQITWYYPEATDEIRQFVLGYTIVGLPRSTILGQELFYQFIEADRSYPVLAARVTLHLPDRDPQAALGVVASLNGDVVDGATVLDGQTAVFTGGPFPPQTHWDVRASWSIP